MLVELQIRDFALVAEATVRFGAGFTVLTGETGAGKSILVDAIDMLLGERAGADVVRAGAPRATLGAVFDIASLPHVRALLADLGLDPEPDGLLHISREITPEGRNPCRVNGRPAPLSAVRALGERLVDLHGQHEHQALLRVERHQEYLDRFGGPEHLALLAEVGKHYARWRDLRARLADMQQEEGARLRELDLLRFQVEEIRQADPQPGEDEALAAEVNRLANAERLAAAVDEAYAALYEGPAEGMTAVDLAGAACSRLAAAAGMDPHLGALAEMVSQATDTIREAARELASYRDELVFDPARLDAAQRRLHALEDLKRKYGGSLEAVAAYREQQEAALAAWEGRDELVADLTRQLGEVEGDLGRACAALSAARRQLAEQISGRVAAELAELSMPAAQFQVRLESSQDAEGVEVAGRRLAVSATGTDRVEFLFSANPGEAPRPLARIASGGEISRVMLALKSALAEADPVPTLVFDEIDSGIGGRTAEAVGARLQGLGRRAQVVCVTHLAQIAYRASHHLAVDKQEAAGRTVVQVAELRGEARVGELARMQAGAQVTPAVLEHIRQMLGAAT